MSELRDTGSRYEMDEQGLTSYADYRREPGRLYIDYVFAPPDLRGTGASGRLMQAVSQDARDKGLRITPSCGYAAAGQHRSSEFKDLVGERQRRPPRSISRPSRPPAAAPRIVPTVRSRPPSSSRPTSAPTAAPITSPVVPFARRQ